MGISSRTTEILRLSEKNEGLKSTNDFLVKQLERRVNQLRDYRKALEEIREIIKNILDFSAQPGQNEYDNFLTRYQRGKFIEIRHNIDEVLK